MTDGHVTVTIPAAQVEHLSSRARSRGEKPRRGWLRHVTSVDPRQRGGYALIGPEPFLQAGERILPLGAVVAECHWDGDVSLGRVGPDGAIVWLRDITTGSRWWLDLKSHTVSTCQMAELLLGEPLRDTLTRGVRALTALVERTSADLAAADQDWLVRAKREELDQAEALLEGAAARLASLPADPPADPRASAIAEVRALMARYGVTVADLS